MSKPIITLADACAFAARTISREVSTVSVLSEITPAHRRRASIVVARAVYGQHHIEEHGRLPATHAEADAHAATFAALSDSLLETIVVERPTPVELDLMARVVGPQAVGLCALAVLVERLGTSETDAMAA
ncbi:hypothetical protein JDBV08_00705 [Mycobacterium phage jiawei]|nr:hypothetical protein JDBV08_00705 [Mycobacterium phage jiawei]